MLNYNLKKNEGRTTMNRDIIQEIINKKSRNLKRVNRFSQYIMKFNPIMSTAMYLTNNKKIEKEIRKELFKYIPIGLVTCIENYFRLLIKDLLKKGSPYLLNITNYKNINIDFKSIINAQSKSLSIPDLISHLIPLNSLENINTLMSIMIEKDFLYELKMREIKFEDKNSSMSIEKFLESSFESVKMVYQMRNIFCHELALNYKFDSKKIIGLVISVQTFVLYTELYIQNVLNIK